MELTWVAVGASLAMGLAAVSIFVFAVKKDYFRNLEDTKYQVFWSDLEELVDSPKEPLAGRRTASSGPAPLGNSGTRSCRVKGERSDADPGRESKQSK
jgi:hypothetical protein